MHSSVPRGNPMPPIWRASSILRLAETHSGPGARCASPANQRSRSAVIASVPMRLTHRTRRTLRLRRYRGDAANLPETLAPYLTLEAIAAGSWDLYFVAMYPEFRGRGLGSELLSHAEKIARESGASRMSIIVEDANAGALRLYLRHGFAEWARRPYVPFPGSMDKGDWVLLGKGMATEET